MSQNIEKPPQSRSVPGKNGSAAHKLPTADEEAIQSLLQKEQVRLSNELGIVSVAPRHATRPEQKPFTRAQRPHTTILFGGLTWKHERLIQAMMTGLGYRAERLPTPDTKAYQRGREYGNNGQCNPTYFTVGNLIQFLLQREAAGLGRQEIIDSYVFFTAGACGPCRFGMYEAEYRSSLRNAGFDGFRVLILEQTGGLNQSQLEAGLEMNLDFTLGVLNALNIGDLLNDLAYRIRPYETEEGATDRALRDSIEIMERLLIDRRNFEIEDTHPVLKRISTSTSSMRYLSHFGIQVFGKGILRGMRQCRERFREVTIDPTRVKPIVKITGEFWAQTTEGDGNFNMFRFLEQEGAQIIVEPIATWLLYMLHQVKQEARDRKHVRIMPSAEDLRSFSSWWKRRKDYSRKMALFTLAEHLFKREYNRLRNALGNVPGELPDQYELQRIAHPYFNSRVEGGEGHLEIAKNIYYTNKNLCHMVLSLKPFGCMPSTQSDGVQSAVMSHFKDILYLPIETSGEGEINAHSRVQMALGEARAKAKAEFNNMLDKYGVTADVFRSYVAAHQVYSNPFYQVSKRAQSIGIASNLLAQVAGKLSRKTV